MSNANVFVSRNIFPEALDKIKAAANVEVWPDLLPPSYEVLLEKTGNADGLLCMLSDKVDANLINSCPKLKVISTMAVGYDNIDIAAATARGIRVGNTPGVLTETTADLTFSLLMAAARRVVEADMYTRQGNWKTWGPMTLLGQDIHHATIGIIGLGRIGTEVAKRARAFGMKVIAHDKYVERAEHAELVTLDELLAQADFISLHTPLTDETRGMINAALIAKAKDGVIIVNTGRGKVVNEPELTAALTSGKVRAYGTDVWESDPPPENSPLQTAWPLRSLAVVKGMGA